MFRRIECVIRCQPAASLAAIAGRWPSIGAHSPVMQRLMSSAEATSIDHWQKALDEEKQKKFARIQMEVSGGRKTPRLDQLSLTDLEALVNMSSSKRIKYYRYLFRSTKSKEAKKKQTELKRAFSEAQQCHSLVLSDGSSAEHLQYGLAHNTLFQRVRKQQTIKWQEAKVARAIFSGEPNLIFDCGFNDTMSLREQKNTAKQLRDVIAVNRNAYQPFVLNFCNLAKESQFWQFLGNLMPNIDRIAVRMHADEITAVAAPDRLVYLTPDSDRVLDEFNPLDCYVIGSIVDRGIREPITWPKAQRLGIRSARLPLDMFHKLQSHKELTLVEMMRIMVSLRQSADWKLALGHVAQRKLQIDHNAEEDGETAESDGLGS